MLAPYYEIVVLIVTIDTLKPSLAPNDTLTKMKSVAETRGSTHNSFNLKKLSPKGFPKRPVTKGPVALVDFFRDYRSDQKVRKEGLIGTTGP